MRVESESLVTIEHCTCGMPSVSIIPVLAYSTSRRPNFESGQPAGASRDTFSYSHVEPLSPESLPEPRPSKRPVVAPVGAAMSTKPSSVSSTMSSGLTGSWVSSTGGEPGALLFLALSGSEPSVSVPDESESDGRPESINGSCRRPLPVAFTPSMSASARHRPDAGPRPQSQSMRASAWPPSAGTQSGPLYYFKVKCNILRDGNGVCALLEAYRAERCHALEQRRLRGG